MLGVHPAGPAVYATALGGRAVGNEDAPMYAAYDAAASVRAPIENGRTRCSESVAACER